MKSKINKYASKTRLMDINLKYGDETFKFNLFNELVIDENVINREIQQQPQSVAFLGMLASKLGRFVEDKKLDIKKKEGELRLKYKEEGIPGIDRPNNDDLTAKLNTNIKLIKLKKELVILEMNLADINTCAKSFDTRSFMLQTLSANTRKN